MTHQHFDLAAAEAKMRADVAAIQAHGDELIENGEGGDDFAQFFMAQRAFGKGLLTVIDPVEFSA